MSCAMKTKRCCWWIVLAAVTVVATAIPFSFVWFVGWTDSGNRCYLYIEHGVFSAHNIKIPRATVPAHPWYGSLDFRRSRIYDPWVAFPSFRDRGGTEWQFKLPLHFPLLGLLIVVVYPILPTVVKRRRRKAGLCVNCEYDLTGNESGVCPECGTAVE